MFFETRWPVIIFSRIIALGEKIDVFPVLKMPDNPTAYIDVRDEGTDSVFLMPDTECDVFAHSAREDIMRLTDAPIAYAAALFVLLVRGVPESEITVRTPSGVYVIKRVGNDGKYGILMPKCKILYTKTAIFADKTDLNARSVSLDGMLCNLLKCADAEMMSSALLRRILLSLDGERCVASVAVSENEEGLTAKAEMLNEKDPSRHLFAAAVAASFARRRNDISVKLFENEFAFIGNDDNLYAVERNPVVFTFHAPDLDTRY